MRRGKTTIKNDTTLAAPRATVVDLTSKLSLRSNARSRAEPPPSALGRRRHPRRIRSALGRRRNRTRVVDVFRADPFPDPRRPLLVTRPVSVRRGRGRGHGNPAGGRRNRADDVAPSARSPFRREAAVRLAAAAADVHPWQRAPGRHPAQPLARLPQRPRQPRVPRRQRTLRRGAIGVVAPGPSQPVGGEPKPLRTKTTLAA